MTITALPTPPSPSDSPATFNSKAFDLLGALPTFVTEANGLEAENAAAASAAATAAANAALASKLDAANPSYTGTLTGGTGVVNLGSGQFYKDASGNVGIGVTPSAWGGGYKAIENQGGALYSNAANVQLLGNNFYHNGTNSVYKNSLAASYYLQSAGAHSWGVAPSGTAGNPITFTQAMTLDSAVNLGLGVTPSAWTMRAFQIGGGGALSGDVNTIGLSQNTTGTLYSGFGATYVESSKYALKYTLDQSSGSHVWSVAPQGTAGNPITFTQAMTLAASGNLGIGTSAPTVALHVAKGAAGDEVARFVNAGGFGLKITPQVGGSGAKTQIRVGGGESLSFATNNTEAVVIDTSGNLLVGVAFPGYQPTNAISLEGPQGYSVVNHANGTPSGGLYMAFGYNASGVGSITQSGTTAVSFNTTSDHRLKENVRPSDARRFTDIRFVDFEWIDGRHDCGVIAHELQAIYPDLVIGEKDATEEVEYEVSPAVPAVLDDEGNEVTPAVDAVKGTKTQPKYQQVNYMGLIARMGTVVQRHERTIEAMQAQLDTQNHAIALLTARLEALESK